MSLDLISIALGLLGLGISVAAYQKANSAKRAVSQTITRHNANEDLERVRSLISRLDGAKEAVSPWARAVPQDRRLGRNQPDDLSQLSEAIDALRTRAPLAMEHSLQNTVKKTINTLNIAFEKIEGETDNVVHWKSALTEIQAIIPKLEQEARKMRDAQLAS